MSWIRTIALEDATGKLKKLYARIRGPQSNVDNIMLAHSLRPHTMQGHMALYKSVLHHSANEVDTWLLESIGIYVSLLNQCSYCVDHHFEGLKRLVHDPSRSESMLEALECGQLEDAFSEKEESLFNYARILTLTPCAVRKSDIEELRARGWSDGEVLEVNQVVAYFNYANRTVLGLGVTARGDLLGLSPRDSDDPGAWQHA